MTIESLVVTNAKLRLENANLKRNLLQARFTLVQQEQTRAQEALAQFEALHMEEQTAVIASSAA